MSTDELTELRATVARLEAESAAMRSALRRFDLGPLRLDSPHPCLVRCFRVGGPMAVVDGVCVECGLRDKRDDERTVMATEYGSLRAVNAALSTTAGAALLARVERYRVALEYIEREAHARGHFHWSEIAGEALKEADRGADDGVREVGDGD